VIPRLSKYARCFHGVVPAGLATCSADGVPNVTFISQVHFVDDEHVALSCQFFNKTRRNLGENPDAQVELWDPLTFECYRMRLRYLRSETSGPLFDAMALRIQVIASHTGMSGVFRLISADVCKVSHFEEIEGFVREAIEPTDPMRGPLTEIRGLQCLSSRISRAASLDDLLTLTLHAFEDIFQFAHSRGA
jgi:hypothetical protein